jgi:hypothetical protein
MFCKSIDCGCTFDDDDPDEDDPKGAGAEEASGDINKDPKDDDPKDNIRHVPV